MKILTIDIENRPNLAYVWGLWDQNVGLSQIQEHAETISFAAKWHGSKKVYFASTFHDGKGAMLEFAHELLSEADVVVGYNSKRFDMPHLNREFVLAGMNPPAPYAQVDLLHVVRRQFKFTSNKLDYVAQQLNLGAKTQHTGFQLWRECMEGKAKAWDLMKRYNKQDVVITEKLYDKLMPWIPNHPHAGLYSGDEHCCPNCGSDRKKKEGMAYTAASSYQRYSCLDCGKWFRGSKRVDATGTRNV